ncbi:hypothetical protein CAL7716_085040 [Calothrix sp. PCC 7716]|nr:hypothetical protein CAL7716_085040 [Calothrix sp. PCC 7716]
MPCPLGRCNDNNCPRGASCLAERRTLTNRAVYTARVVESQEKTDLSREFTGEYAGYDSKTGEALIKLSSGSIVRARTVSNGLAKIGDKVSGTMPLGSTSAIVDWMVR